MSNMNSISLLKFWVSHAIMCNVRQIKLDLLYAGLVEFPETSLALKTLEVLNLRVKFFLPYSPLWNLFSKCQDS